MSRKLVSIVYLFVLSFPLLYARSNPVDVKASNSYPIAPDFTLTDINGTEFSLSDNRGKVVLIDFCRVEPSCPPCVSEISHLRAVYDKYSRSEVVIIFISISPSDTNDTLRDFVEQHDIPWIVACGTSQIADEYEVQYVPTLVIVDQDGYIRYRHEGLTEEPVLSQEIEEILLRVHNINTGLGYPTIQEAIDANETLDGHTIFVDAGTYTENLVVNKTVTLIGQDRSFTIIDGNKTGDVIEVKADNVTISEFTIRNGDVYGWHAGWGVYMRDSSGCTVSGNNVIDNKGGICIEYGSIEKANCMIEDNKVNNNFEGISLYRSDNCTITGNNVTNSRNSGIYLFASSFCTIAANQIQNTQEYGIYFRYLSNNNTIYHNNLIDNGIQAAVSDSTSHPKNNTWDNSVEGNYWSDYIWTDTIHDGIGDSWYEINENNTDHYPLMGMFSSFNTSLGYYVNVISNSTVEDFQYFESNSTIKMYVSGEDGFGFCRVCIPHVLMDVSNISVIIDDEPPVLYHNYTLHDNGTHRWIYFAYPHSTHEIDIITEFLSFLVLPLFIIATLLAVILYRRKHSI